MTEFVRAIKTGDLKKIKYFIEEEYVDTRFTLSWAGEYGHLEVVKYLVSLNPPPICDRWDRGDDCIVNAAVHGHLELVKYLVSLGANIFQDYIFSKCAENGQIHILEYIISLGGNIILPDTIFWTASNGQVDTLKYLVSQGADVRIEDDEAMIRAAISGHLDVILYLVEMGANIRTHDDAALQESARNGRLHVVKYLISRGADVRNIPEEIFRVMSQDTECFETIRYLISLGANVVYMLDNGCKMYLEFCEKMEKKIREKAQKKIYFWWIPICYSLVHPSECGQRMMIKNWEKTQELFDLKNNVYE